LLEARAPFEFAGPVRVAVHRLKYGHEHARAAWGAVALAETLRELAWPVDLIVPVPLHAARERERGYNQSEKLAARLSYLSRAPIEHALVRRRATTPQVTLDAEQRYANVAGAFDASMSLRQCSVVLVDDVLTTGATINDCARACLAAGAREVRALTVATGT
jgi:ComF family protein